MCKLGHIPVIINKYCLQIHFSSKSLWKSISSVNFCGIDPGDIWLNSIILLKKVVILKFTHTIRYHISRR